MRTTVDVPEDLLELARAIARDTRRSFSATVTDLMRRGLGGERSERAPSRSKRTGLPLVRLGTTITSEDVRRLENDEP